VSTFEDAPDETQRRIFSSISSGIVATVIVSALGAVSIRAITTRLGAAAFGIFILVQSYVTVIQTFTDLGLAQVLQRDIARGDQDEKSLLSHAMGLRITLSVLAVPIAVGLGFLIYADRSSTLKIGLVVMLCSIPFAVSSEVSSAYFSAKLRNTILAVIAVIQQVVFVGLVILAVSLHKSVVFCLGAALVGMIVGSILTSVLARREVPFTPSFDRDVWWSMLRTSSPIGLAYVVGLLYFKADTLILSFLSTAKQIGYYGAAYSIVSVFLVLPTVLTRTFLPSMVRASKETIERSIHSTLTYFAIGGTFSATAIMICGPTVIRIVAGSHFGASNPPLRILGVGLIFIFIATALSSVCVARGSGNKIFVMSVVSLVLNVALNIVAIPKFGIKGAAVATLICEVISLALFIRLVRKEVGVHIRVIESLARPFAAGLVPCLALAPLYLRGDLNVGYGLALIPATCVLYLVSLALLKGLPQELVTSARSWVVTTRRGRQS
jgi:O-antigen/teichoic acid export membrane protein